MIEVRKQNLKKKQQRFHKCAKIVEHNIIVKNASNGSV